MRPFGLLCIATLIASIFLPGCDRTQVVHQREESVVIRIPKGRVIYAVVAPEGVYFGEQLIPLNVAPGVFSDYARREHIENFVIYCTDLAKFGDVVGLYRAADRSVTPHVAIDYRPLRITERKPMTSYLKAVCCYSLDVGEDHDPSAE